MRWRHWNSIHHRDIGFLCIGLTLVYAISGVAVNHISEWNPSYSVERVETTIGTELGNPIDAATIRSFLIDLDSGLVVHDRAIPRPGLREMNFLHLKHPNKSWSWFADIHAVALGFLAISGMLMIRRDVVLTAVGFMIPLLFFALYL